MKKKKTLLVLSAIVVLATLIPLALDGYAPKNKTVALDSDKLNVVQPVLGPIYDESIKTSQNTTAQSVVQAAPSPKPAAAKPPTKPTGSKKTAPAQPSGTKIIGNSPVIGSYTQTDLYWLAKMIFAEASAEPYNGQVAVGDVILHRVAAPGYPKTIKGVLYQVIDGHYQFTPVLNGYINQVEPNSTAYRAAKDALAGIDPSRGAMLYYNPKTSTNQWILSKTITTVIGNHTFAK